MLTAPLAHQNAPLDLPVSPTIVVAEDEPTISEMVSELLTASGYRVIRTGDGVECATLLERVHAEVDAVLLDLSLPRLGGAQVLQRLRAFAPTLPVVVMSGVADPRTAAGATDDRAVSCLAKPFGASDLRRSVQSALLAVG